MEKYLLIVSRQYMTLSVWVRRSITYIFTKDLGEACGRSLQPGVFVHSSALENKAQLQTNQGLPLPLGYPLMSSYSQFHFFQNFLFRSD